MDVSPYDGCELPNLVWSAPTPRLEPGPAASERSRILR